MPKPYRDVHCNTGIRCLTDCVGTLGVPILEGMDFLERKELRFPGGS